MDNKENTTVGVRTPQVTQKHPKGTWEQSQKMWHRNPSGKYAIVI